jgi:hypothetical protein
MKREGTGVDEDKKERKPTHRMTFVINIPKPSAMQLLISLYLSLL